MRKENFDFIIASIVIFVVSLVISFNVWAVIKCWNVPLMERRGVCAMLHGGR